MSPEEAMPQLLALRKSLKEADWRDVLPTPAELREFSYIVVRLQIGGCKCSSVTWSDIKPETPGYPQAFQVLVQVDALIEDLKGRIPNNEMINLELPDERWERLAREFLTEAAGDPLVAREKMLLRILEDKGWSHYINEVHSLLTEYEGRQELETILKRHIANPVISPEIERARNAIAIEGATPGKETSPAGLNKRLQDKGNKGASNQRLRIALRILEALGEYDGFGDDRSQRRGGKKT